MKAITVAAIALSGSIILAGSLAAEEETKRSNQMKHLIDFKKKAGEPVWVAENDGVMGGLSKGGPKMGDGTMIFSGELSLENNGGFSSIQADVDYDLSGKSALIVRVKGDGRTYQFRLATDARYRNSEVSYWSEFKTEKGEWVEVSIPLDSFSPSHHGEQLDGPPLDLSKIEQVRFLLGDKKPGAFELEVDWVAVK